MTHNGIVGVSGSSPLFSILEPAHKAGFVVSLRKTVDQLFSIRGDTICNTLSQDGSRQFVENASRQPIDEATRRLIDKLLLECLGLAAIARVTGVSFRWLQLYVNQKFYQTPKTIEVTKKMLMEIMSRRRTVWFFRFCRTPKFPVS